MYYRGIYGILPLSITSQEDTYISMAMLNGFGKIFDN